MHLWRGEYDPFIYEAHFKFCYRMIVVPMSTFHQLAEKIGDPAGEVIFLPNTTRCGSTLLTQVSAVLLQQWMQKKSLTWTQTLSDQLKQAHVARKIWKRRRNYKNERQCPLNSVQV